METIPERIKRLRIEKQLSQDELAALVGYTSRSTVNKVELGKLDLPLSKFIAFAKALGTSPSYLFDGEGPSYLPEVYSDREKSLVHKYRRLPEKRKDYIDEDIDMQLEKAERERAEVEESHAAS